MKVTASWKLCDAGKDPESTVVRVSPSGEQIASGGAKGLLQLWAYSANPTKTGELKGHDKDITDLAYSPSGELLASAAKDFTVRVWDQKGNELHKLQVNHPKTQQAMIMRTCLFMTNEDGSFSLMTGSHGPRGPSIMTVWSLSAGAKVERQKIIDEGAFCSTIFDAAQNYLAVGFLEGDVKIYQADNFKLLQQKQGAHSLSAAALAFITGPEEETQTVCSVSGDYSVHIMKIGKSAGGSKLWMVALVVIVLAVLIANVALKLEDHGRDIIIQQNIAKGTEL
mmetsp:Transcript_8954/g.18930  ORF Transcript_8954/g.18930 Transcript_8954/m.18930 type:complete len:281 (+) Transcript_8954:3-845(+)